MTKKEVVDFMNRIKSHYQEFVIDDFKTKEWFDGLKNYDVHDVNEKLNEHLKSLTYGAEIPKLYFLTKYLTQESEKNKQIFYNNLMCPLCEASVTSDDFDYHYGRCSSVYYVAKMSEKFFDKKVDKAELYEMPQEEFDKKYLQLSHMLLSKPLTKVEHKLILKQIYPDEKINIDELFEIMFGEKNKN